MFGNARNVDASTPNRLEQAVKGVKLGLTVLALVLLVGGLVLRSLAGPLYAALPVEPGTSEVTDSRPLAEGSPAALIAEHDCWTGEAPADMAGKVPGRVVVTLPNGTPAVGGERMVARALAQVFDGVDHGLTVAAFCR